ncbi:hypothetical protein [Sulfitobacter sp. JB4-11]|uniref:hypothetical protein n=1 Tax=Sulfitobacter rhodophyticola TaxID=3238304 RepID=UPI00351110FC
MNMIAIFSIQFALSIVIIALLSHWYLAPWLAKMPTRQAMSILIMPHVFRHLGLVFLVPVVVDPAIPEGFANAAGWGDFSSALLALLALVALRYQWRPATALIWLFSLVGMIDLLNALRQADAVPYLGAAWFIPTFIVPLLLVTHVMIVTRLVRSDGQHAVVA